MQERYALLSALQQSALGIHDDHTKIWLSQYKIDSCPRLAQMIQVNTGWEIAVETVLEGYFDAVCIEKLDNYMELIEKSACGPSNIDCKPSSF